MQTGATKVAIRFLLRTVQVDAPASPEVRARVRLNLSAAYSKEGMHYEALECAREAGYVLEEAVEEAQTHDEQVPHTVEVLRAVALHNCCASHEFLGQHSTALAEARKAYRLASAALPGEDPLVSRLRDVEASVEQKVNSSFGSGGKRRQTPNSLISALTEGKLLSEDELSQLKAMDTSSNPVPPSSPRKILGRASNGNGNGMAANSELAQALAEGKLLTEEEITQLKAMDDVASGVSAKRLAEGKLLSEAEMAGLRQQAAGAANDK